MLPFKLAYLACSHYKQRRAGQASADSSEWITLGETMEAGCRWLEGFPIPRAVCVGTLARSLPMAGPSQECVFSAPRSLS